MSRAADHYLNKILENVSIDDDELEEEMATVVMDRPADMFLEEDAVVDDTGKIAPEAAADAPAEVITWGDSTPHPAPAAAPRRKAVPLPVAIALGVGIGLTVAAIILGAIALVAL